MTESPSLLENDELPVAVCALYKFVTLPDYQTLQSKILDALKARSIKGTLLLAEEGINGTIAGEQEQIHSFLNVLKSDQRFNDIDYKLSYHKHPPFNRTKVKLKKEIVTMGIDGIDPNGVVGTYVEAEDWNNIISDPQTIVIDTRNDYEYEIGTFQNAINPETETFREFPEYVNEHYDPNKVTKVAMFCTGGIRCEKASSYMKQKGYNEVYHLKGGILKYLETVPEENSLWQGECFVFDDRVAVNHQLEKGSYDQCHACRYPITDEDKKSKHYQQGVSCPRCYNTLSNEQRSRFAEREKQIQLAKQRGENHIGDGSQIAAEKHRKDKQARKKQQH